MLYTGFSCLKLQIHRNNLYSIVLLKKFVLNLHSYNFDIKILKSGLCSFNYEIYIIIINYSEGWEKLGLYEYYKAKNAARKMKEEAIAQGFRQKSKSPSPIPKDLQKQPTPPGRRYR